MIPMLGRRVTVILTAPEERVSGELRQQAVEGVWIFWGWAEKAALHFYPTHRVLEIKDDGPLYR